MMESRVAEGKASPRRDFWSLRGRNNGSLGSNLLETIAQMNGGKVVSHTNEDGVMRMKLLVRKQDLKQMLEVVRSGSKGNSQKPSRSTITSLSSAEQRLNLLRRKHLLRANTGKESGCCSWTPELQIIPEEL